MHDSFFLNMSLYFLFDRFVSFASLVKVKETEVQKDLGWKKTSSHRLSPILKLRKDVTLKAI